MTVYIIQQDDKKNLRAAGRFGAIKYLFTRGVFPDNQQERVKEMIRIARKILQDFDPKTDYIVPIGDPVSITIVAAILSEMYEIIPVLKWDGEAEAYYPVTIDLQIGDLK